MRVGLVGYACATGVGYECRRMWRCLPFERWMVMPHDLLGDGEPPLAPGVSVWRGGPVQAAEFVEGLDAVVAVERSFVPELFEQAQAAGARTVLCVNPEWFVPGKEGAVDVHVVRTPHGAEDVARRAGPEADVRYVPCPLDTEELPQHTRVTAERFLFSNGWGGVHQRKGWPVVSAALRAGVPGAFTVFSQRPLTDIPPAVRWGGTVARPADLFADADVAVQPSRFEGVGLAILEAMACGLPVITTDAPPMNGYLLGALGDEAQAILVPVERIESRRTWVRVPYYSVTAEALRDAICRVHGADIRGWSRRCAEYVRDVHGPSAWDALWRIIGGA